jgi:small subunit ribosomal protein S7
MPRRGNIAKRDVLADPIYNSKMVTRLVNSVMLDGKKGVAQKIVYEAFSMIQEKTGNDPLETFEKAMENIMPSLQDPPRRWCQLPGSSGSQPRPPRDPGPALVDRLQPQPW